jgi:hypothetical protein
MIIIDTILKKNKGGEKREREKESKGKRKGCQKKK